MSSKSTVLGLLFAVSVGCNLWQFAQATPRPVEIGTAPAAIAMRIVDVGDPGVPRMSLRCILDMPKECRDAWGIGRRQVEFEAVRAHVEGPPAPFSEWMQSTDTLPLRRPESEEDFEWRPEFPDGPWHNLAGWVRYSQVLLELSGSRVLVLSTGWQPLESLR
jgi:hypothetical protein